MNIRDRVAIVTGASRGVGAACAAELARRGAKLVLVSRSPNRLPDALALAGDLTDSAFRVTIIPAALKHYGRIDILINNAGVGLYGTTVGADPALARRMFELNLFAPLDLIQQTIPVLRAGGGGAIVNVSSIGGRMALPWMTLYSASKFALTGLSEGLRMELTGTGIQVMSVFPGYVTTDFQQNALGGEPPEAVRRARRSAVSPAECAAAIVDGIERNQRTVYTPWVARVWETMFRVFSGPAEARLAAMLSRRSGKGGAE